MHEDVGECRRHPPMRITNPVNCLSLNDARRLVERIGLQDVDDETLATFVGEGGARWPKTYADDWCGEFADHVATTSCG